MPWHDTPTCPFPVAATLLSRVVCTGPSPLLPFSRKPVPIWPSPQPREAEKMPLLRLLIAVLESVVHLLPMALLSGQSTPCDIPQNPSWSNVFQHLCLNAQCRHLEQRNLTHCLPLHPTPAAHTAFANSTQDGSIPGCSSQMHKAILDLSVSHSPSANVLDLGGLSNMVTNSCPHASLVCIT